MANPLSGETDSLLINLRSFPSTLFVFFLKRGTFRVHVFSPYFLHPTQQAPPDSSGSSSTFRGESEMTSGIASGRKTTKFLYASIPAIFEMPSKISSSSNFKGGVEEVLYELCAQNQNFCPVRVVLKKEKRCSVFQQFILRCRSPKNGKKC